MGDNFAEKEYGKNVLNKHRKFTEGILVLNWDNKSYNRMQLEVKTLATRLDKH